MIPSPATTSTRRGVPPTAKASGSAVSTAPKPIMAHTAQARRGRSRYRRSCIILDQEKKRRGSTEPRKRNPCSLPCFRVSASPFSSSPPALRDRARDRRSGVERDRLEQDAEAGRQPEQLPRAAVLRRDLRVFAASPQHPRQ